MISLSSVIFSLLVSKGGSIVAHQSTKPLPSEVAAISRDYADDLLALFTWALDLKLTDVEKTRFIKEREMEWHSGHSVWQFHFAGDYAILNTLTPQQLVGTKENVSKPILDFIVANAKNDQPDIIWIQKHLGKDDEVVELPKSTARRAPFEKFGASETVASVERPERSIGSIPWISKLSAYEVSNSISKISELFEVPLNPDQRQSLFERAIKHWKKFPGSWGSNATGLENTLFSYVNNSANYMVYKRNTEHNIKVLTEYAERGDRDSVWLEDIRKSAYHNAPLISSEPRLTRNIARDYATARMLQFNEVVGKKVVVANVADHLKIMDEIAATWTNMSESKKAAILNGRASLGEVRRVFPIFIPLKQEHMRHLWGLDMVKTMPQLKPLVDARTKEFADIAKKYPNWKEEMEQANQAAFQAYLQQKQQEHERLMKSLDRMYDSVVFSGKMRQLSSLVTNAPSGSTVNVTIHP